jgi:uncharacterized membrane protein YgaE (UPF0421/DUF939 family)
MVWLAAAILMAFAVAWLAMRRGGEGRRTARNNAVGLTIGGFASMVLGSLTGNLAIFYGGALVEAVALPATLILSLVISRDHRHPGRW